jgi:hypothetical protein
MCYHLISRRGNPATCKPAVANVKPKDEEDDDKSTTVTAKPNNTGKQSLPCVD